MKRYKGIDILKFIGLLCIILAHVYPPDIILQLRGFDVVLMIIISSYLFFENNEENIDLKKYWCKRLKRLLLPTYFFLIIFFISVYIVKPNYFPLSVIIDSFLLHNGIGYVWIIRIYLIIAFLLPILNAILKKYSLRKILFVTAILYIIYEMLYYFGAFDSNIVITDILAYIIPCLSIIVVCYWLRENHNYNKNIILFSIINLIICFILALIIYKLTGEFKNTNYAKYPFRLYYLSYAFGISGFLILMIKNKKFTNALYNKFVQFISKSSLWIYLWHIAFLYLIDFFVDDLNWFIRYLIVVVGACLVTYIQNMFVNKLENTRLNREFLKILRG